MLWGVSPATALPIVQVWLCCSFEESHYCLCTLMAQYRPAIGLFAKVKQGRFFSVPCPFTHGFVRGRKVSELLLGFCIFVLIDKFERLFVCSLLVSQHSFTLPPLHFSSATWTWVSSAVVLILILQNAGSVEKTIPNPHRKKTEKLSCRFQSKVSETNWSKNTRNLSHPFICRCQLKEKKWLMEMHEESCWRPSAVCCPQTLLTGPKGNPSFGKCF